MSTIRYFFQALRDIGKHLRINSLEHADQNTRHTTITDGFVDRAYSLSNSATRLARHPKRPESTFEMAEILRAMHTHTEFAADESVDRRRTAEEVSSGKFDIVIRRRWLQERCSHFPMALQEPFAQRGLEFGQRGEVCGRGKEVIDDRLRACARGFLHARLRVQVRALFVRGPDRPADVPPEHLLLAALEVPVVRFDDARDGGGDGCLELDLERPQVDGLAEQHEVGRDHYLENVEGLLGVACGDERKRANFDSVSTDWMSNLRSRGLT